MGTHKCTRSFKNSQVSSKWIANKYLEQFKHNPTWPISALMHNIKRSWKVDVSRCKLYRAKTMAKTNIFGMHKDQYARLWDYYATLRRTNPRSCIFMNVARPRPDRHGTFRRLYISLAAMRDGFRAGCRPLIGLDGCFLKGPFKGQMLCAVGRDGNENIYPVAFAAVEAETKDNWSWFLDILVSDLGPCHPNGWTFIFDRQKGLIPSFAEVLPNTDHRICVRHLYVNFRDEGHHGQLLKDRLWAAASAYTKSEFETEMCTLKALSEKAHKYLFDIDPALWARSHFSTHSRSDLLVNNLSECFNSYILDARDKPIITMMKTIRKKLMRWYQMKREGMSKMDGKLCPTIMRKLDKNGLESCDCVSTYAGDGLFEVDRKRKQYVVNLKGRTCGCRRWDLTGIPCAHGIFAILYSGEKPKNYVDDFYTMETYMKAYEPIIRPMPSVEQWEKTPNEPVLPPIARVRPGRPKKVRRRATNELKSSNRVSKIGTKIKYSKCGKIGHNSRTCKKNGATTTPPTTFGDVPISQSDSTTVLDSMISGIAPTNHENSSQGVVGITQPPSWGRTNSTPTQASIELTRPAVRVIEKRKGKCHVVPIVEKGIEVMLAKKKKQKH